ncbi:MerR family transcriptional regulator [Acidobacteria bacterium AH-259-G07]|nr:MerR family transcriptional regulator [Acidobacteria bacterium AH-259-G07]
MARIGKKLFYKIGEICRICGIQPHVLRYWETEFTLLSPAKNRAGQRIYREKDLRLIQTIQQLLYEQGYTIAGANQKLLEDGHAELPLFKKALKVGQREALNEIERELQEILKILDKPLT